MGGSRGAAPSVRGGAGAAVRQRELVQARAAAPAPALPQRAGSARPGAAGAAPAVTVVVPEVVEVTSFDGPRPPLRAR